MHIYVYVCIYIYIYTYTDLLREVGPDGVQGGRGVEERHNTRKKFNHNNNNNELNYHSSKHTYTNKYAQH